MNWDQVEGKWKQFSGKAKEKWGKITDDDWDVIRGRKDQLVGKVQERYGIAREEAEKQADEFVRTCAAADTIDETRSDGSQTVSTSTRHKKRGAGQR
jgi:uncharacterized protein YjbJ (UPF0337 family)